MSVSTTYRRTKPSYSLEVSAELKWSRHSGPCPWLAEALNDLRPCRDKMERGCQTATFWSRTTSTCLKWVGTGQPTRSPIFPHPTPPHGGCVGRLIDRSFASPWEVFQITPFWSFPAMASVAEMFWQVGSS